MNFKSLRKPFIPALLAAVMLFVSCSQYDDINDTNQTIEKQEYNGEQLFKSIFFGSEDLNLNINHINKVLEFRTTLNEEQLGQLNKFSELVVTNIKEKNKSYFETFKTGLYSKDHYEIQKALDDSALIIEESMLEIPEVRDAYLLTSEITKNIDINKFIDSKGVFDEEGFVKAVELEYGDELDNIITPTVIGVWLVAALVQTVVVAVSYYVGVFVARYTPWDKTAGKSIKLSQLQNEILINDIYENL
jgi:SdpC family antimicrobial peptide